MSLVLAVTLSCLPELARFDLCNLLDAPRMPAALERGVEPDADHLGHQLFADQVRREAKYIRVVVAAAHLGRDQVMAGHGANGTHFVRRDAHAQAGPVD